MWVIIAQVVCKKEIVTEGKKDALTFGRTVCVRWLGSSGSVDRAAEFWG